MKNKLVSLSGYSPRLGLPEEGVLPYEQMAGLGTIEEMSALSGYYDAATVEDQLKIGYGRGYNVDGNLYGVKSKMKKAASRVTSAASNVVQTGVQAAQSAAAKAQAAAQAKYQDAKAKATAKAIQYIETQKAKALSATAGLAEKYPAATVLRSKGAVMAMLKNPTVQQTLIMAAATATGNPGAGAAVVTGMNIARQGAAGIPTEQLAQQYGAQAVAYVNSVEGQAFNAFLQSPTVETLQQQMNNFTPEQVSLAQAFLEEAERNVGADVQKLFENAFSIFDYVVEGKLY